MTLNTSARPLPLLPPAAALSLQTIEVREPHEPENTSTPGSMDVALAEVGDTSTVIEVEKALKLYQTSLAVFVLEPIQLGLGARDCVAPITVPG